MKYPGKKRVTRTGTDRIKWTAALTARFEEAVEELGGLDKAQPVHIMRIVNCSDLTRDRVKSFLQKCRNEKQAELEKSFGLSCLQRDYDSLAGHMKKSIDDLFNR